MVFGFLKKCLLFFEFISPQDRIGDDNGSQYIFAF